MSCYNMKQGMKRRSVIKKFKKRSLKKIVLAPLILVMILVIWQIFNTFIKKAPEPKTQLTKMKYADSTTPTAYSNFLANALNSFYKGGSTNGKKIKAHHYYPTTNDLENKNWTKKNLPLGTKVEQLLTSSELTYKPKGCKQDKPSGPRNACTSYIITSNGSAIYDSTK